MPTQSGQLEKVLDELHGELLHGEMGSDKLRTWTLRHDPGCIDIRAALDLDPRFRFYSGIQDTYVCRSDETPSFDEITDLMVSDVNLSFEARTDLMRFYAITRDLGEYLKKKLPKQVLPQQYVQTVIDFLTDQTDLPSRYRPEFMVGIPFPDLNRLFREIILYWGFEFIAKNIGLGIFDRDPVQAMQEVNRILIKREYNFGL